MKKLFLLLAFHISLFTFHLYAQVSQEWVARGSWGNGQAIGMDSFEFIYVAGEGGDSVSNYANITIIKYSSTGTQQWIRKYYPPSGLNYLVFSAMAVDSLGNVYVTASQGPTFGPYHMVTMKYNANGDSLWNTRYYPPTGLSAAPRFIKIDRYGNVYVGGGYAITNSNYGALLIKYNPNADSNWVKNYVQPGNTNSQFNAIVLFNNNIYISGLNDYYYLTAKFDPNGDLKWVTNSSESGVAVAMACDASGNIIVTGIARVGTGGNYLTIKYNISGVQQWSRRYAGPVNMDNANSIAVDSLGNSYITGKSASSSYFYSYATVKYSSAGVQQWDQRYDTHSNLQDITPSLALDNLANVYIVGRSDTSGSNVDYVTVKYNTDGVQQWLMHYDGPIHSLDVANAIILDQYRNVYVTGGSTGSYNHPEFTTIKYAQPLGIKHLTKGVPKEFKLYQNFPNPFNNSTIISYQIPITSDVKLVLYDILGSEITVLVNEKKNSGTYHIVYNGNDFSSGVYFYRLFSNNLTIDTKKLVLIK